jgi:mRNA-degrading endonuclease toxin of MazEF toxin-antitoxin module
VNRGDIYYVDLGPIPERRNEQSGERPAIAVSLGSLDPSNPLVIVFWFTGKWTKGNHVIVH